MNMCKINKENNKNRKNTLTALWSRDAITSWVDWFDGSMTDQKLIGDR